MLSTALPLLAAPITILTLDWTSQVVLSHVFGRLLERSGYEVRYLSQPADSQWFLLSSRNAHLQVEMWEGSMASKFDELVGRGLILDAGDHAALTREEWWFPDYVREDCPGLPDWQALNACAGLFREGDDERGVYYTGPWEKPDKARIRALGLNYRVETLPDSSAIRQRLETAVVARKPVLIFNWTPNWVEAVHPGHFVEFPEYAPACETDPGWGVNPSHAWDCGNPRRGWLKKAVSRNLPRDWPCAHAVIRAIRFDNAQIASATALYEVQGLDHGAAAATWLAGNETAWREWLDQANCHARDDGGTGQR